MAEATHSSPTTGPPARRRPEFDWRRHFVEDFGGRVIVYGTPRATMRVLGWMLVCDPPEQTAGEIQDGLRLSAGSVSTALRMLGDVGMLERFARPGDRHSYYRVCAHAWERVLEGRFRTFTEMRTVADRALQAAGHDADHRLLDMRDTYALFETGVAALLRESLERDSGRTAGSANTRPPAESPAPHTDHADRRGRLDPGR